MTKLSLHARKILMQPIFSIKAPNAFALDDEYWVDNVPVLRPGADGKLIITFPSYNTRPTVRGDQAAQAALDELQARLSEVAIDIYIAPGEWVIFDNSKMVHRRGPIGDGPRKLWRNYVRGNCDAMRAATAAPGPIFSARALLEASRATQQEVRHVA